MSAVWSNSPSETVESGFVWSLFYTRQICNLRFQKQGSFHHIYSRLSSFNKRERVHSKEPIVASHSINEQSMGGNRSCFSIGVVGCSAGGRQPSWDRGPDASASVSATIRKQELNSVKDACVCKKKKSNILCSLRLIIIHLMCKLAEEVQRSTEACKGHKRSTKTLSLGQRSQITFNDVLPTFSVSLRLPIKLCRRFSPRRFVSYFHGNHFAPHPRSLLTALPILNDDNRNCQILHY